MKHIKWWGWGLITLGVFGLAFFALIFFGNWGHFKDVDYDNPPKFVTADFIELSKIDTISKFRSAVGHDYSGNGESCRSMRHYFGNANKAREFEGKSKEDIVSKVPDPKNSIAIYAPADGRIGYISSTRNKIGKQLEITPKNGEGWQVRLDHIYPVDGIRSFGKVRAGQKIGVINEGQAADITILYKYRGEFRLTSYFQVMTDDVFARYQARGIRDRKELIIPREVVDANPWECDTTSGDTNTPNFAKNYTDSTEAELFHNVHLSGWISGEKVQKDKQTDKKL